MQGQNDNPGFVTRLQQWALFPVTNQMDMLSTVLTAVLVVTVAYCWIIILKHITEG